MMSSMDNEERLKLARAWIAYTRLPVEDEGINDEHWWAIEKMSDMERADPESLWLTILLIHSLNEEQEDTVIAGCLAAGPLENLLAYHGPQFIDRVEAEARRNPKFAFLLCGVWQNSISDEIWTRVLNTRNENGWDAILQKPPKDTH